MSGSWTTRLVMGDEIETTRLVKRRQASGGDKIETMRVRSRGNSGLQAAVGSNLRFKLSLSLSLSLSGRPKMGVIGLKVK